MSTKPSDTVRFARTAGGVDSAHITTPSAGLRDNGYGTDAIPTSGDFDFLLNLYGKWCQYLSDGDLSGNHTIAGTLTMGASQSVVVSGTGDYKHGDRQIVIGAPGITGTPVAPFNPAEGDTIDFTGTSHVYANIPLPAGCRIKSIDIFYQRAGSTALTFTLRKTVLATATPSTIATVTINTGSGNASITIPTINYTMLATEQYRVKIDASTNGDKVAAVVINYDRP